MYFFKEIFVLNFFKHGAESRFLFSSKCHLFHNATFFGSCIIRILHTVCAKIIMPNSSAKRLIGGKRTFVVQLIQKVKYIYIYSKWQLGYSVTFFFSLLFFNFSHRQNKDRLTKFRGNRSYGSGVESETRMGS
jgi:hypothetical protein